MTNSHAHAQATILLGALNMDPKERTQALKGLYSSRISTLRWSEEDNLTNKLRSAYRASPISRDNHQYGVLLKRLTLLELKDYIPWEVIAGLLASRFLPSGFGGLAFDRVFAAIEYPASRGWAGGRAKHGYYFGYPADAHQSPKRLPGRLRTKLQELLHAEEDGGSPVPSNAENIISSDVTSQLLHSPATSAAKGQQDMTLSAQVAAVMAIASSELTTMTKDYQDEYGTAVSVDEADLLKDTLTIFAKCYPDIEIDPITAACALALNAADLTSESHRNIGFINGADAYFNKMTDFTDPLAAEEEEPAQTPTPVVVVDQVVIDPTLAPMLDAVMNKATNGAYDSIVDMATTINVQVTTLEEMEKQLKVAQLVAHTALRVPANTTPINGIVTTWEMKSAAEVFRVPGNKKTRSLDFLVPVFTHKDDSGQVVDHPMVPALDPNYVPRRRLIIKFLAGMVHHQNIYLHGHTGTGKSTLPMWIAAMLNMICLRVNLDGNIERPDLVGEKVLNEVNGATVSQWVDGVLPQAMGMACMLVLDEMDAGRPEVMFVLQRALEGVGLLLNEDGGRLVEPHQMFMFVATANTKGQGDEYGVYPGTRPLNAATLDRFTCWIEVEYLNVEEERKLLAAHAPNVDAGFIEQAANFAKDLRSGFIDGEVGVTVSPRGLMALCTYYGMLSNTTPSTKTALQIALEMTMFGRIPSDGRQRVEEIAQRWFT